LTLSADGLSWYQLEPIMRRQYTKLPATQETKGRLQAIAEAKGWTLTKTVINAADALARRERIGVGTRRRKSA
jgi:hypothetical protein